MFTLAAFNRSVDQAGAYAQIYAVADPHITIVNNEVQIPEVNKLMLVAGMMERAAANRLRLYSPSLRMKSKFQVTPLNMQAAADIVPDSPPKVMDLRQNPLSLIVGERLGAESDGNPAAAQYQSVLVWFCDAVPAPVQGEIFCVRATGATALVANAWTDSALAFDEDLPRGRYAIVGMRALSAGCIAARLFLPGARWRPGCLGVVLQQDLGSPIFRLGQLGSWGEFEDTDTVTGQFLSISADATQQVYLDLMQVRSGPA
jgi:hypothetical protein